MFDFPLKWRWTDERYCLLSLPSLAQIRPFTSAKAKELLELSFQFSGENGLLRDRFNDVEQIDASLEHEVVRDWLMTRMSGHAQIVVSWDADTAVQVPPHIFCDHWDDFCYPSSDDVIAWPINGEWALSYSHYEEFDFGRFRK